jgi:hypothetical protein
MASTFKMHLSKLKKGADNTADLAILQTQLMLSRTWLRPTYTEMERIKKFIDINDSLDALESLIVGKIGLGLDDWKREHRLVKEALSDPNMPYYNLEHFRITVKRRYKLYNLVLQSLGYYTKEIMRNDAYDKQEGQEMVISGL